MMLCSGHPSLAGTKACGHQLAAVSVGAVSDCFVYQQFPNHQQPSGQLWLLPHPAQDTAG